MYKRPDKLLFMGNAIRDLKQVVLVLLICLSKTTGKPTVHLDANINKFESKHNIQLNCTTSEKPIPIAAFLFNDASFATIALSKTTCRIGQEECKQEECDCGPNFFFYNVTTHLKLPQNTFTCELRFNKRKKKNNVHISVRSSILHNESGIFILEETKEEKGQVMSESEDDTINKEEKEEDGSDSNLVALTITAVVAVILLIILLTSFYLTRKRRTFHKNDKGQESPSTDLPLIKKDDNNSEDKRRGLHDTKLTCTKKIDKKSDDKRHGSPDMELTYTLTEKDDKKSEDKRQGSPDIEFIMTAEDDKKFEDKRNGSPDSELTLTKKDDTKSEDEIQPVLDSNEDSENAQQIHGVQEQHCAVEVRKIDEKLDSVMNEQLWKSDSEQSDCTSDEDDKFIKLDYHDYDNCNIVEIKDGGDGGDTYVPPYSVKGMNVL